MATINTIIENSLMIVTVTGETTAKEMIEVVLEYYPTKTVKDVIWDLTNGSMKSISEEGFTAIAKFTKTAISGGLRQGGKTVFVGGVDSECNILRMYKVIAELTGVPVKYNVFKTIKEARNWLEREG